MDENSQMIAKIVVVYNDAIIGHSEHQYVATGMPTKSALKDNASTSAAVEAEARGWASVGAGQRDAKRASHSCCRPPPSSTIGSPAPSLDADSSRPSATALSKRR